MTVVTVVTVVVLKLRKSMVLRCKQSLFKYRIPFKPCLEFLQVSAVIRGFVLKIWGGGISFKSHPVVEKEQEI